ncbi:MAG: ribbon-helix-helix protein, CopG family [Chloroflexi bacterium]|nr:ribbon-helix-helix protein, CopG family [Chloroflexota bacterium]
MKTAISIPDSVFQAAESLAKRLGISRSELFRRAVDAYIDNHKFSGVREALDDVYSQEQSGVDAALSQMQSASLPKEDW